MGATPSRLSGTSSESKPRSSTRRARPSQSDAAAGRGDEAEAERGGHGVLQVGDGGSISPLCPGEAGSVVPLAVALAVLLAEYGEPQLRGTLTTLA